MVGWLGGWSENWRVMLISAFNYVIVEVVAEIGNIDLITGPKLGERSQQRFSQKPKFNFFSFF